MKDPKVRDIEQYALKKLQDEQSEYLVVIWDGPDAEPFSNPPPFTYSNGGEKDED